MRITEYRLHVFVGSEHSDLNMSFGSETPFSTVSKGDHFYGSSDEYAESVLQGEITEVRHHVMKSSETKNIHSTTIILDGK